MSCRYAFTVRAASGGCIAKPSKKAAASFRRSCSWLGSTVTLGGRARAASEFHLGPCNASHDTRLALCGPHPASWKPGSLALGWLGGW